MGTRIMYAGRSKYGSAPRELLSLLVGGPVSRAQAVERAWGQVMKRLERQKLIETYERGGKDYLRLTDNGRERVREFDIEAMRIKTPKRWDGLWRLVTFDIPEKHKRGRMALQGKLRELGFYPLQKSVYVFPYDCHDEIDFVSEFFGVRRFVHYMEVREIFGYHSLEDYFELLD